MNIAVIGTGYVGLVTGAGFAELGHHVTCVDIDAARIDALRQGRIPIHEPGLEQLVTRNAALGRLGFTTSTRDAVAAAQVVFIAVGTPSDRSGAADLSYVLAAARDIGRHLAPDTVVVTKSTVPVGTADKVRQAIAVETEVPFSVASNPEFLREGAAISDFLEPARVVIGADDAHALAVLRELHRGLVATSEQLIVMDVRSAELTKYACNTMLATRISFMNELSHLTQAVGADIDLVRLGMGSDPRIGPKFLQAGCGFGGSCFGKDLRALLHTSREHDVQLSIVDAAERSNERQQRVLGRYVISHFGGRLQGRKIGVWGLAFKPETDDIREAPALTLIRQLLDARATVAAYDPVAMANVRAQLGETIELVADPYAAARDADALVLVTEWHDLCRPDLAKLAATMRTRLLFDGRNAWPRDEARRAGFVYRGIGRP